MITDRYPQNQVAGNNDGPLLSAWAHSASRVRKAIARYEARPYNFADRFAPDLVLRLNVDADVAATRRPGQGDEYLAKRIALVGALRFPTSRFGVTELDANQPYDEVLRQAVDAVFSRM